MCWLLCCRGHVARCSLCGEGAGPLTVSLAHRTFAYDLCQRGMTRCPRSCGLPCSRAWKTARETASGSTVNDRPGAWSPGHFEWRTAALDPPRPGEVLVRVRMLSVDPSQRVWMAGPSYRPMLQPGQVMASYAAGEVVRSESPDFAPGDCVERDLRWQDYTRLPACPRAWNRRRCPGVAAGGRQLRHADGAGGLSVRAFPGKCLPAAPVGGARSVQSRVAPTTGCPYALAAMGVPPSQSSR